MGSISRADGATFNIQITKEFVGDKVEPILTQEIVEIYKELSKDKKNGLEFSHGDFAPWNLKRNGDKYTLFDWEHCGYRMPGFDLMHYATIVQKVLNGKELSEWCMGFPTYWNDNNISRCQFRISTYTRMAIKAGLHDGRILPFIQQESTFWTKELWEKSKGSLIRNYKMAGDFQLWKNFAKYEPLYKVNSTISGFRQHEGQKSSDKEKYYFEVGNFNMLYRFFVKTKLLKIFDALLSLTKRKDRILLQDLYKK